MKYEFKPLCAATYDDDLDSGWIPVLRADKDDDTPRDLYITFLPSFANWETKAVGVLKSGEVYQYTSDGLFNAKSGETCLDVIMRREVEVKPKERTIAGMAYVTEKGQVISLRCEEDSDGVLEQVAAPIRPIPCTITLHSQEHEST